MRSKKEFVRTKMLKGIFAIAAAAVCAGAIVGFIPEPDPAAAAVSPRSAPRNEQGSVVAESVPVVAVASACTQTWPYYEQSCLRDSRQAGGSVSTARIVPILTSYPVKAPVPKIAKLAGGSR
jgi:hypothetical protein